MEHLFWRAGFFISFMSILFQLYTYCYQKSNATPYSLSVTFQLELQRSYRGVFFTFKYLNFGLIFLESDKVGFFTGPISYKKLIKTFFISYKYYCYFFFKDQILCESRLITLLQRELKVFHLPEYAYYSKAKSQVSLCEVDNIISLLLSYFLQRVCCQIPGHY